MLKGGTNRQLTGLLAVGPAWHHRRQHQCRCPRRCCAGTGVGICMGAPTCTMPVSVSMVVPAPGLALALVLACNIRSASGRCNTRLLRKGSKQHSCQLMITATWGLTAVCYLVIMSWHCEFVSFRFLVSGSSKTYLSHQPKRFS